MRSPNPISNDADDRDRLEDGQDEIDDIGIVELVTIRQPPAPDEMPVDPRRRDEVCGRIDDRFCFQKWEIMRSAQHFLTAAGV